jgi:ankyrin repeat protein
MSATEAAADLRAEFIREATWHGTLERAEQILAAQPALTRQDIHTAAVVGDDALVHRFLEADATAATAISPPYGGNALVYLCLSKYLRLDPSRSDGFLRAATALLDAGADANSGFWSTGPHPEFETALYGAAGVAHHEGLTRLLIERGADPNDEEAVYHSPETRELGAMKVLVETGRLRPDNLVMMLIRKHDWHDYDGIKYLLERGADPNGARDRGWLPLPHALARDNARRNIALLLDHGVDPQLGSGGRSAVALAARHGRSDVLDLFEQRGIPLRLEGVDRLIAACARGDRAAVRSLAAAEPHRRREVLAMGGELLARFAGIGNPAGVEALLDLGVDVALPFAEGDGYFGIPPGSLAIHVAAWRAAHEVVRVLLQRGSPVDVPDANGRTPLALAVRACVDSYWMEYRSPESAKLLLDAGASVKGIPYPCGYDAVDELLRAHRAAASP